MRGLDRRVQLQHRTVTKNERGDAVDSYATYATVWALKRDTRAQERFAGQQVQAELDTVFQIRYRNDVLATDRLICEGRTFDIRPGAEIGRRVGLEILATAVVS